MATEKFSNNAITVLSGPIDSTTTTIVVDSASLFPTLPQFRIRIDDEILLVLGVAGTTFTVTRGVEGTSNVSHLSGALVTQILTSGALTQFGTDLLATPGTITASTPTGDVPVTGVVTQTAVNAKIPVNTVAQALPRMTDFDQFMLTGQGNVNDASMRAIMSGDIYLLRQQDRYIDPGTGQVRSRCWNNPDKYVIIGETGDACPQIWWTGGKGVKTQAGATSCVRIPNAQIDPDSTFTVTMCMQSIPGNTVDNRPMIQIGSQHTTDFTGARMLIRQHTNLNTHSVWGSSAVTGYSLCGMAPHVWTLAAATGAGGVVRVGIDGTETNVNKVAGTIFSNDHVIGGWWDEAGGVWHSYKGFYLHTLVIHTSQVSLTELTGVVRAMRGGTQEGTDRADGVLTLGQSNNGHQGAAPNPPPSAPTLPDHRSAQNETSFNGIGTGWEPVQGVNYYGYDDHSQYSVTQGIAQHLPGRLFFKMTLGGQQLISFYDWTTPNFEPLVENLLRQIWQVGRPINLQHIITVSSESEADISLSAAAVRSRYQALAASYRMGFQINIGLQNAIRITVSRLNDRYALVRPVGTPLTQEGQDLFVAGDVNARIVNPNSIPLLPGPDNTHYDADGRVTLGSALGVAAIGP